MPTVHTNVNSEDEDLGRLAEAMWNFAHGDAEPFTFVTGDGYLTVEGHWEDGLQVVTFTDTQGAVA